MPKFLVVASYTADGVKGLMKDGGTGRRAAVERAITDLGGRMEGFYFAFGEDDVFVIADAPDTVSVAALGLAVASTGLVRARTVMLLSPEDVDSAIKKSTSYRAPGQ